VAHNKVKQNTRIEKKSKKKEEKTQDKQQRGRQAGQRNKMSPNLSRPSQHKITVILLRLFGSAMQAHLTWQRSVNKEHKNRTSTFCCCVHILYNHITCISQQPKLLILPIEIRKG
jgi:hypothetical protein